jgi:predicted transposase YbfD/YdcC
MWSSAWATENRQGVGQVKMDEKSNEITAIPEPLEKIALEGCIVTIDAMGCQYEIADQIEKAKAGLPVFVEREPGKPA